MKYNDFEKLRTGYDFAKDNVTGSIIFFLCALLLFLGGFYYQQSQKMEMHTDLRTRLEEQYQLHQKWKQIAEERNRLLMIYEAERVQVVDISFYTASKKETDDTPNQTSTMTYARPGFTVAVSHDLKWMLGHYIYIYKRGVFYVEDLMNERYTKRLDILVGSKAEIPRKGVLRDQEVVVLGKELELYYE